MEKHSESRLSYLFAHLRLLSSDSFSSDLLSSNLSLLSASALLCFSSVHIVGSLTSELPWNRKCDVTVADNNFVIFCSPSLFDVHYSMMTAKEVDNVYQASTRLGSEKDA